MSFAPDHGGIAVYATDCAKYLHEVGHDVSVVTSFPWYPAWKKRREHRGRLMATEIVQGIRIYRGFLYVPQKVNTFLRILQEISFLIFAFLNFLRAGKHDVILIFTTPVNLGLIGTLYRKIWRARLIINVQDLQVDIAHGLDLMAGNIFLNLMSRIEIFTYKQSNMITSISYGMLDLIRRKGIDERKLYYMPNWVDIPEVSKMGSRSSFRTAHPDYQDKTIIAYAGNVGEKQGLETLIDLALQYKDEEQLIFLVIGSGSALRRIKTYAADSNCRNVHFLPFMEKEEYFDMLNDIDASFIPQMENSGDVFFPSKLLDLMAKSKLLIVSAHHESELYQVVHKHNIGIATKFGNMAEMRASIDRVLNSDLSELRVNAFRYVHRFDRNSILRKFEQHFLRLSDP